MHALPNDEMNWIKQALQGDKEAFAEIVNAFQIPVFNLCCRLLGDPYRAEDAAQETFHKAYRYLESYDPRRKFVTWILSIASHHCIDQIRRKKLPTISLNRINFKPAAGHDSLEDRLTCSEVSAQIQSMVGELGELDRAVVVMFYWHDMSYEEIADALHLTASAVKSRLHRSRRCLAGMIVSQTIQGEVDGLIQGRPEFAKA